MLENEAIKKYVKDSKEEDVLRGVLINLKMIESLLSDAQSAEKACYIAGVSSYSIGLTKIILEEYLTQKYGVESPTIL